MFLASLLVAMSLSVPASAAEPGAAGAAFQRLSALAGQWEARTPKGALLKLEYKLVAGGSALVETWQPGSGRETMTVYHLDGDRLLADHFCAQGNVPRLELEAVQEGGTLAFAFREGSNLHTAGKSHLHRLWVNAATPDVVAISEAYVRNGAAPDETAGAKPSNPLVFRRVAASK
jgi:hypothetical protein